MLVCLACGAEAEFSSCAACGHRWREVDGAAALGYYAGLADRSRQPAADLDRKFAERLALVRPFLRPGARVLEIGCADGGFGERVKAACDLRYEGVEPSRDAEAAAARLDRVWRAPLAEVDDGVYDVVLAFHVIEHVPDLAALLGEIRGRLAPGGVLVAEVPHEAGHPLLDADPHPEHVHSFTSASLAAALRRADLTVTRLAIGGFESPLYPDGLRVIARPSVSAAERRAALVERFRRIAGPTGLVIYGLGGDFRGWVAPYLDALPDVVLIDGDPARAGERVAGHPIALPEALAAEAGRPVLVASYRFEAEIRARLLELGVAPARIYGLADVYGPDAEAAGAPSRAAAPRV